MSCSTSAIPRGVTGVWSAPTRVASERTRSRCGRTPSRWSGVESTNASDSAQIPARERARIRLFEERTSSAARQPSSGDDSGSMPAISASSAVRRRRPACHQTASACVAPTEAIVAPTIQAVSGGASVTTPAASANALAMKYARPATRGRCGPGWLASTSPDARCHCMRSTSLALHLPRRRRSACLSRCSPMIHRHRRTTSSVSTRKATTPAVSRASFTSSGVATRGGVRGRVDGTPTRDCYGLTMP